MINGIVRMLQPKSSKILNKIKCAETSLNISPLSTYSIAYYMSMQ
jgi:hypothetical protein